MAPDSTKTVEVTGYRRSPKRTLIEAAETEYVIGDDESPLDALLGSLAACINVIGHLVARDQGLEIRDLHVHVAGDIDTAKFKGESTVPRAGFESITVSVEVDADADRPPSRPGSTPWPGGAGRRQPAERDRALGERRADGGRDRTVQVS